MTRNPAFGIWPSDDDRGRAALPATASRGHSALHCPDCGRVVEWEVVDGRHVALERGRLHLCDPDRTLVRIDHRDGKEVLATLRRIVVQRRMHGAAV